MLENRVAASEPAGTVRDERDEHLEAAMRSFQVDNEALAPFRLLHRGSRDPEVQRAVLAAVAGETPLARPVGDLVLLAGDWHGSTVVARRAIEAKAEGISTIIQLGDFGFWSGHQGAAYLDTLSSVLTQHDQTLLVVDGNHEDFDLLARFPLVAQGPAAGLRPIRPRLWHLPRGTRWTWPGPDGTAVRWLAVGGAVSVDAGSRTAGIDWWPQEELTEDEVARICADGPADVVLCHDRPAAAAAALHDPPGVWHDRGRRQGWLTEHLIRADVHAARLQRVLDGVQPERVWHGHLHQRTNVVIDDAPWGSYRVQGLAHDERPAANAVVVTLDGREASP